VSEGDEHMAIEPLARAVECFDTTSFASLVREFETLSAIAAAVQWTRAAEGEISRMEAHIRSIPDREATIREAEAASRLEHRKKPFLRRFFTSHDLARTIRQGRRAIAAASRELPGCIGDLRALIERTPDSLEKKKALLAQLRLLKKDLREQNSEASLVIREVRTAARQAQAKVGSSLASALFTTPTMRRYKRIAIRTNKEKRIAPLEDVRVRIDRQLQAIEREIIRVERLK
jgi:hypothetical protein